MKNSSSMNEMPMGNNKRRRLLMCFKPVTTDEEEDMVLPTTTVAVVKDGGRKRKMWQTLWAAFRWKSLMKKMANKMREKKEKKEMLKMKRIEENNKIPLKLIITTRKTISNRSSTTFSSSSPTTLLATKSSPTYSARTSFSFSSSWRDTTHSPTTSPSPLSLSNRTITIHHHHKQNEVVVESGKKALTKAKLMLMFGFLLMIVWGKCLAIAYTSAWFYMARPERRRPCNNDKDCNNIWHQHGGHAGDICGYDCAQMQRKIIMEGLLVRSNANSPRSLPYPL